MSLLDKNLDNVETEKDLFGSGAKKLSMKERIGFVPISIWQPDWNIVKQLKKIVGDDAVTRKNSGSLGYLGSRDKKTSIFNPHLSQMILSAYCPPKAKIYDPFAGGGTRGFIAVAMQHKYWGLEIREEEVNRIKGQQKVLNLSFDITVGDAQYCPFEENFFDFSYTCPPYYNLEVYSKLETDLSSAKTYIDFLKMLKLCMIGVYKGLKKGGLSVWVVGNFRDSKGELTPFNSHLVMLAKKIGFKLHDELIFWGASKCAAQRSGQFEANRKSVRVHEYIIIFKK